MQVALLGEMPFGEMVMLEIIAASTGADISNVTLETYHKGSKHCHKSSTVISDLGYSRLNSFARLFLFFLLILPKNANRVMNLIFLFNLAP